MNHAFFLKHSYHFSLQHLPRDPNVPFQLREERITANELGRGNQSLSASLLALDPESKTVQQWSLLEWNILILEYPPSFLPPPTTSIFTQQIYPWAAPSPRTRRRNEFIRERMRREVSTVDTARGQPCSTPGMIQHLPYEPQRNGGLQRGWPHRRSQTGSRCWRMGRICQGLATNSSSARSPTQFCWPVPN